MKILLKVFLLIVLITSLNLYCTDKTSKYRGTYYYYRMNEEYGSVTLFEDGTYKLKFKLIDKIFEGTYTIEGNILWVYPSDMKDSFTAEIKQDSKGNYYFYRNTTRFIKDK